MALPMNAPANACTCEGPIRKCALRRSQITPFPRGYESSVLQYGRDNKISGSNSMFVRLSKTGGRRAANIFPS